MRNKHGGYGGNSGPDAEGNWQRGGFQGGGRNQGGRNQGGRHNNERDQWRQRQPGGFPSEGLKRAEKKWQGSKGKDALSVSKQSMMAILNKITIQNFDKLCQSFVDLPVPNSKVQACLRPCSSPAPLPCSLPPNPRDPWSISGPSARLSVA